ncbi:MAG: CHAD domain-containing protein [Gemmatimonadaceae bacterium]
MKHQLDWDPDSDSAQRAARVVALRILDAVADAHDSIRKKDPESIHDFRIALRRLRSWLRTYRTSLDDTIRRRVLRSLRRISRATTELRDLDVQLAWLRSETSALGEGRLEAAKWVIASIKADRKVVWRKLERALDRKYASAERDLRRQLTHYVERHKVNSTKPPVSMRRITARALEAQATALSEALARIRSADDAGRLHRARIAAKRTRYVLDAIHPELSVEPAVVDDLARFQDSVGELRDAQLLAHRVAREVTAVAAERTAIVASELVYHPRGAMDFSRIVDESPFDASLALLFARLHDRIAAASRGVTAVIARTSAQDWRWLLTHEGTPTKK